MNKNLIWIFDELLKEGAWGMTYTKFYDCVKFELDKDPTIVVSEDQLRKEIIATAEKLTRNKYIPRYKKNFLYGFLSSVIKSDETDFFFILNRSQIIKPTEEIQIYSEKYLKLLEEELKRSKDVKDERNLKLDYSSQIRIFLLQAYRKNPSSYGTEICKKIMFDSMGKLIHSKPDDGDAYSLVSSKKGKIYEYYEIKSSYSQKLSGEFRIAHIRDYQDFNYFIICLVDTEDDFQEYFYLLDKSFICENSNFNLSAMNNTKKANMLNVNIDKGMSIKKDEAFYLFGMGNLLCGTSYDDLLNYFRKT